MLKDITHIERSPLPWRPERATECGLDATRHPTWSREEALSRGKELGRQRFSMFVCMTCFQTMEHHATWSDDPASCLVRHASGMQTSRYGNLHPGKPEQRRFADELRAIAALIENHREEFDAIVRQLGEVVNIQEAQQRAKLLARAQYDA